MNNTRDIMKDSCCGNVVFFLGYGWLGISTPPLMCALHLANRGWHVDIFTKWSATCETLNISRPQIKHPRIRVIYDNMRGAGEGPLSLPGGGALPTEHHNAVRLALGTERRYSWAVGFDPAGLLRAAAFAEASGIPYIYHSLEIDENGPLKPLEKICHQQALFAISQDQARASILAHINDAPRESVLVLPNSAAGEILPEQDNYFRETFPAIGERRIVLASGTLLPECCIHEIVAASQAWPQDVALVLHGWIHDAGFKKTLQAFIEKTDNIFLSEHIFAPDKKFRIYQSSDVCLVFYASTTANLKYAAGSSGKLYDALRCGTPMIGNDIPGMAELLHNTGCGIVVPDASKIGAVLPTIFKHHAHFRQRCFDAFPCYEFDAAYERLLHTTGLIKAPDNLSLKA